jgi:hypothetical protein
VSLTPITAISSMVAPVVLITTGGMLSNGLLVIYSAVNDRMREMTQERIAILTGPDGEVLEAGSVPPVGRERLAEIADQLPMMGRRHRLVRDAVLCIYGGISLLVLSVIGIAVAVTTHSDPVSAVALAFVLGGTVVILAGLVVAARSLARSTDAINYAVERTRQLGGLAVLPRRTNLLGSQWGAVAVKSSGQAAPPCAASEA